MGKITKKAFLSAAKDGWKKLGYASGAYYLNRHGDVCNKRFAVSACAIGAAAYALDISVTRLCGMLEVSVTDSSDYAGSKKAALAAIAKIKWPTA